MVAERTRERRTPAAIAEQRATAHPPRAHPRASTHPAVSTHYYVKRMADMLQAITGMPAEEAAGFLEMAGGNVEQAVAMYFEMQGGGGGGGFAAPASNAAPAGGPTSPAHSILFGSGPVPPAWLDQGFEFSTDAQSAVGIVQHKNGPCGALAAVNAEVIAVMDCPMPSQVVTDGALLTALARILLRCRSGGAGPVVLAKWASSSDVGGEVATESIDGVAAADELSSRLSPLLPSFKAKGGCVLFCYSCILTHGVDAVKSEANRDGGGVPLVSGPFALCGTELISLLLGGVARCNVGAYDPASGAKVTWRTAGDVGLISADELESGVPVCDVLKSPLKPVYVMHGGDHFTVLWHPTASVQARLQARVKEIFSQLMAAAAAQGGGSCAPNEAAAKALEQAGREAHTDPSYLPTSGEGFFDVAHWNGLPPNKQMGWLRIRACGNDARAPAPSAPEKHTPTQWRLTVGEIESIVQASPEDKKRLPGAWKEHKYEIALVTPKVAEDDSATPERPADVPPPLRLEQGPKPSAGAAWRCASCYNTRFSTMCFGENSAPAGPNCKFCGQSQELAGWTLWRSYAELPAGLQKRIDRTNGPKILKTLRTRWSDAAVSVFAGDRNAAEVELGSKDFDSKSFTVPAA